MAYNNTEIKIIRQSMDYGPMAYGSKSGEPTVRFDLSSSENNAEKVGSIDKMFNRYGWKDKLRSGFARLRIGGADPLSDENIEPLTSVNSVIDPRFVELEIQSDYINSRPARTVQNMTDFYSIFVPTDRSYDADAFEFFADHSRTYGDVEFIFEIGKMAQMDDVADITREFKIYDSDVWLYPKGKKVKTMADRRKYCVKRAKSESWNVSPRSDLFKTYRESYEEETNDE